MQGKETLVVSKEESLSSLNDVADGDVEQDNSGVGLGNLGGKFAVDVISIGTQFLSTVGESEGKRTSGEIPC